MKLTKTKIKSDDINDIIINIIILIYNSLKKKNQEICMSYLLFEKTFTYHSCFIVSIHLFFDLLSP